MKKIRVVLSFDDGRKDNYFIANSILIPNGIKATINITSGFIDGSLNKQKLGTVSEPMSINEVVDLHKKGIEIACHGDMHKNSVDDIDKSLCKLKTWIGIDNEFGFASPNCILTKDEIIKNRNNYDKLNIKYIRIEARDNKNIIERICRHISIPCIYAVGYTNALLDKKDKYILYSIPVKHSNSLKDVIAIIKRAKKFKKDCVFMFHSISDEDDDQWSWPLKDFVSLCNYLKNDKEIETCTTMELINNYNE